MTTGRKARRSFFYAETKQAADYAKGKKSISQPPLGREVMWAVNCTAFSCRSESPLPDEPPCDHGPLSLDLGRPAELAHEGLRDEAVCCLGDLNPTGLAGGLH